LAFAGRADLLVGVETMGLRDAAEVFALLDNGFLACSFLHLCGRHSLPSISKAHAASPDPDRPWGRPLAQLPSMFEPSAGNGIARWGRGTVGVDSSISIHVFWEVAGAVAGAVVGAGRASAF
jgi:hypothetical protein